MSQHLIPPAVLMCLGVLVEAQLEDSTLTDRAYVVLEKQNLGKILQRDAVWALVLDPTRSKKIICIVFILSRQLLLFNESCELEPAAVCDPVCGSVRWFCPHSHAGQRPRSAAAADDHHGCVRLQTAVPSVKLSRKEKQTKTKEGGRT